MDDGDDLFKVLVVGEPGVGKTALIRRYVHNIFQANTKTTIGVDFALKELSWDNRKITLQIWDVAGQERLGTMTRVFYQGAMAALVVYDVSNPDTFDQVSKWKEDLDSKVFLPDGSNLPCILLANKCDLPANPARDEGELDRYCKDNGFVSWLNTSSKEKIHVNDAFHQLVEKILEVQKSIDFQDAGSPADNVTLGKAGAAGKGKEKKKCCG